MLHGFLGAGKTTFARHLEDTVPAIRFTHDEWMTRLYGEDPPADQFPDLYRRVADQIGDVWPRCVALGASVVLDSGFWSRAERDTVRAIAARLGVPTHLHALTCPEDIAWQRIERRNHDLGGSLLITRATFDLLKRRFEPLESDEIATIHLTGETR